MRFSELLKRAEIQQHGEAVLPDDPHIRSVHYRSQSVSPGGLFVAVVGQRADGHVFIPDATSRGAVALVTERDVTAHVPWVRVADTRRALARIATAFYGEPAESLCLVGITGTNGKTSVSYLVERMLERSGFAAGVIGTINYRYAGKCFAAPVTTPESLDLQHILAEMKHKGITHVVMEASSHGIDLSRVAGCHFDVAAFTNLTQDHLDYHHTMAAYWDCKKRLFTEYLPKGPKQERSAAVINGDNAHGRELLEHLAAAQPGRNVISYGASDAAFAVRAVDCVWDSGGIRGGVATPAGSFLFRSPLVGRYNMENILCAVAVGVALGLPIPAIRDGVESLALVPGRLEPVENDSGRYIFVDYAHTPDALENVLAALVEVKRGRLICVFGCGGDRDRAKRPLMGRCAATHGDLTVVTSDNPRTEDPNAIISDILAGIPEDLTPRLSVAAIAENGPRARGLVVESDRKRAIELGIRAAEPGDMVLIAGKGHETYQILGKETVPFDDREVAREVLAEMKSRSSEEEI